RSVQARPSGTARQNRGRRSAGHARAERSRQPQRAEKDAAAMATRAIVGEKVGMTQVWDDDNRVVPVTVLRVRPCRVVQVKTHERDGYTALQVTFGQKKASKLTKPIRGQFERAGVEPGVRLLELRPDDVSEYEVGQEIGVDLLSQGELVDVTSVSKGKGTSGVMKRHGFRGLGGSHGTHRVHRAPGSIGGGGTPPPGLWGTPVRGRAR